MIRKETRRARWWVVLILLLVCGSAAGEPKAVGWLEWSWLQPGHVKIKTKLDTGAKTSSIHALDVEVFERDDKRWVRFRIPLAQRRDDSDHGKDLVMERPVVREARIKDHTDESHRRYVVNLDLCLGGSTFTTPVNLADRGRFNYPLLLGRVALSGRVMIDPARIFTASRSCPAPDADKASRS